MTEENLLEDNMQEVKSEDSAAMMVPEKFRDPETGEVRLEALINSYKELERKLSSQPPAMPDLETEDGRMQILRALGVPETADQYEVDVSHGLFEIDPDMNTRLHQKGFTAEQVQEVYALAAEKLVPAILEMSQEFEADREVERLVAAFGGPEKWQEISRQLLAYGRKNLPDTVLENLSSSFEGVMALYHMMKGQEPGLALRDDGASKVGASGEGDLRQMMRDPRYWREKDPSFVARVTEGFQKMYGQ